MSVIAYTDQPNVLLLRCDHADPCGTYLAGVCPDVGFLRWEAQIARDWTYDPATGRDLCPDHAADAAVSDEVTGS